jgi:hypothetical protein
MTVRMQDLLEVMRAATGGRMLEIDLRPPNHREMADEARRGVSLGPQVDRLVDDLVRIGTQHGFLSYYAGRKYDCLGRHKRARYIGERLNTLGGLELMQAACLRVDYRTRGKGGRLLEQVWDGVGEWRV